MQLSDFEFWIDINLPPKAVGWLKENYNCNGHHFSELNYLTTGDNTIFSDAKKQGNVIIITKDEDFVNLVLAKKPPPKIIWLTTGNITNKELKIILITRLKEAIAILDNKDNHFVEING